MNKLKSKNNFIEHIFEPTTKKIKNQKIRIDKIFNI